MHELSLIQPHGAYPVSILSAAQPSVVSEPSGQSLPWFAIQVRGKRESLAYHELCRRGFESFLPLMRVRRRWSDRIKTMESPVFPGYLFCRFTLEDRFRVLNSPGVTHILGTAHHPVPVDEVEIRSVQALVRSQAALTPWPRLHVGERIRIEQGPMAGVEGILARADDGQPRLVVTVTLLNRAVAAEVQRDWLCPR